MNPKDCLVLVYIVHIWTLILANRAPHHALYTPDINIFPLSLLLGFSGVWSPVTGIHSKLTSTREVEFFPFRSELALDSTTIYAIHSSLMIFNANARQFSIQKHFREIQTETIPRIAGWQHFLTKSFEKTDF